MKLSLLARAVAYWCVGLAALAGISHAQDVHVHGDGNTIVLGSGARRATNVVVPQVHSMVVEPGAGRLGVGGIDVYAQISQGVAVTMFEVRVFNPGVRIEAAELMVPVPDGAVIRGFDFLGTALEPTATLLPAEEARREYDRIVSRSKDPALLEFAGHAVVRSSVFPVPPGGEQRVRLVYEQVLPRQGDRIDYELPRSESLLSSFLPLSLDVRIQSKTPISAIYSPSHELELSRGGPGEVRVQLTGEAAREPGAVQISYLLQGDGVNTSLFAFPDAKVGGGYFLLLAGLPVTFDEGDLDAMQREVVLVLDRSGSMQGEKFEQARAAALQILSGLSDGERFNVVDYSSDVASFSAAPVPKTAQSAAAARAYIEGLGPGGGTALNQALLAALGQAHEDGTIPIVLFLTDGLPTRGERDELAIRKNAEEQNPHQRRVFTIGVGYDVNVPLLDRVAEASRATSEFVQPGQDVEVVVSEVFARLQGPVLATPRLRFLDGAGGDAGHLVSDLVPAVLPDLYEGDRVLVVGKYRGEGPPRLEIGGTYLGERQVFGFGFDVAGASLSNSFVPRLWASRKIAALVDEIRQAGADPKLAIAGAQRDPHLAEITEEILSLSTEFGVLTEYTAFLALEGTDLSQRDKIVAALDQNLLNRAQRARIGRAALNQSVNARTQIHRGTLNRLNRFLDPEMMERQVTNLRQVGDRTFFLRQGTWVEAQILLRSPDYQPEHVIELGSPEHRECAVKLAAVNRAGVLSLDGPVLLEIDGKAVLLPGREPLVAAQDAPAVGAGA